MYVCIYKYLITQLYLESKFETELSLDNLLFSGTS